MSDDSRPPIFSAIIFRPDAFAEFPVQIRPQVSHPGYSELQDAFASVFTEHYADPTGVRVHRADRLALERSMEGLPQWSILAVYPDSSVVINQTTGGSVQIVEDPQVPQGTAVIVGDRRRERWVW
ncbi:hypothetical protein [Frankia sp. AgW1.1]|uniref:hypothetical protein n=1 Tax=Frankia sp. AgW1.1 TaxID=1836971 RepID=UPI0019322EA3|nr:hypothetical protein [Frankia sp. AgW1.1]MBL7487124.1 hypothetical protein [Frankia sp. AgW1.1]